MRDDELLFKHNYWDSSGRMFCGAAGALMVSCQPRSAVTDRRYKMKEMSLLTELEILGAGLLQRWRAYGAAEYSAELIHSVGVEGN
jgi:hypothetical protein